MSDHNERAFLKDKFKDFDVASMEATKNAVMSKIQKKNRKKRFFIVFFLSVFAIAISTMTIQILFNNISKDVSAEKLKGLNDEIADSSLSNDDLNKDINQKETNKTATNDRSNIKATQSDFNPFNLKSNKLTVEKNKQQHQNNLIHEKINADTSKKTQIREKPKQKITNNKMQNNRNDRSKAKNESTVNRLTIKPIRFLDFAVQHSKLLNTVTSNITPFKESRWIIGSTFSYNTLRSTESKSLTSIAGFQISDPNNSPNEALGSQNLFKVSSIMTLEFSVIRKLKNRFYLESGIRYTNLYSFSIDERMKDHLLGIPLKISYAIPLNNRWAINLSTGINYNLSTLRSKNNSEGNSNITFGNFANFQLSTAEFNVGLSYFISEKFSVKLSPQFNYLIFLKEENLKRNFHNNFWFGGQFGMYFHLN